MEQHEQNPTKRFSNRVDDYVRYRPGYPPAVTDCLRAETGLDVSSHVADVGSGTGILSRLLLDTGGHVYGVEPNAAMRAAAERDMGGHDNFTSVDGCAEATTLEDNSIDLVTVAQAFHWFDRDRTHDEFARILTPGGYVALLWNTRLTDANTFMRDYEQLLVDHAVDYGSVDHRHTSRGVESFFSEVTRRAFEFTERLTFAQSCGRTLSASYVPAEGHPGHDIIIDALHNAFTASESDGRVDYVYETELYLGNL